MRKLDINEVHQLLLEVMVEFHNFCEAHNIKYYMIGGTLLGVVRHKGFIPWDDDMDVGMLREDYEKFLAVANQFSSKYYVNNYRINKKTTTRITRIHIPGTYIKNNYPSKYNHDLFLDIFPIDNVPDDQKLAKKQAKKILFWKNIYYFKSYIAIPKNKFKKMLRYIVRFCLLPISHHYLAKKMDKLFKKYSHVETKRVCSMGSQYSFEKQTMCREIYGNPVLLPFDKYYFYAPQESIKYLEQLYGDYNTLSPIEKRKPIYEVYLLD